jgi:NAD(P)-dependent dehydrogenase (short-subunit alcohol dehydrogenase family)
MSGWSAHDIPAQRGRVAVVTGANSGLGLVTARELARAGARVVMTARDPARGAAALERVRRDSGGAVELQLLDLASLASVHDFADRTMASYDGIDLLVNNAGIMAIPRQETADGFEMQFGTNHLGHFALTGLLLPSLLRRPGSRVVTVSSAAHKTGTISFDDVMASKRYQKWLAYSQSKLANLLFAFELQRRLAAAAAATISVAAHPGYTATNLQAVGPRQSRNPVMGIAMNMLNHVVGQSADDGALPQLYAATSPDVRGGEYFGPSRLMESRGAPKRVDATSKAKSLDDAARLWAMSEELTDVRYDLLEPQP